MKMKHILILIAIAVAVIAVVVWRVGGGSVAGMYPGLVNSEDLNIPEETRAQWEIQLNGVLATLEENSDDMAANQAAASYYNLLGEYAKARQYIEKYVQLNTINPVGWTMMGDILVNMQDYEAAESAYKKSLSLGVDENIFPKLERLYRDHLTHKYDEIERLYIDAIELDEQRDEYLVKLARWYAENDRWQEAADHMEVVAKRNRDNDDIQAEWQKYLDEIE